MTADDFQQQLEAFCRKQLARQRPQDITRVTTHLILSTAFLTGATIHLAKARQIAKPVYLAALKKVLSDTFRLADKNADGLIESNARMYKHYKLIENIYNSGWRSAQAWLEHPQQGGDELNALLQQYHNLAMTDLGIEGVKQKPAAAPVAEAPAAPAAVVDNVRRARPYRVILLSLLLVLLLALLGGVLLPQFLPPALQDITQPWRALITGGGHD